MRKFSKVLLVIAATAGVVGIGLTIGGASMGATIAGLNLSKGGFGSAVRQTVKYVSVGDEDDWNQDWDEIDESDSKEAAGTNGEIYLVDGVSKLDLSIRTGELYLKEYNGNEIKVEVSGKHREKVRVGQEGDTLVLESIGRVQDREITVSYPKKTEFEEASVDVVAGTVNLDDNFYAKKLEVSVAAGEFTNDGAVAVSGAGYLLSYASDCIFAGIHFCLSGYFYAYGLSVISFIHNSISIVCARIPLSYYASVHFKDTLFPMGCAAPAGSLISVVICVGVFIWLEHHEDKYQNI